MKIAELESQKADFEIQISYMENKVANEEAKSKMLLTRKEKLEKDLTALKIETDGKIADLKNDVKGLEDKNERTENKLREEEVLLKLE